jgi:hypothetical protein
MTSQQTEGNVYTEHEREAGRRDVNFKHEGVGVSAQKFLSGKAIWSILLNVRNGQVFYSFKSNAYFFHSIINSYHKVRNITLWAVLPISLIGAVLNHGQKLGLPGTQFFKARILSSVPEGVNKLKSLRKLKDKENGNYPAT